MAKTPMPRATAEVDQWNQMTLQLIQAASDYAASGQEEPETSAMIRQLKVMTAAFMAALNTIR